MSQGIEITRRGVKAIHVIFWDFPLQSLQQNFAQSALMRAGVILQHNNIFREYATSTIIDCCFQYMQGGACAVKMIQKINDTNHSNNISCTLDQANYNVSMIMSLLMTLTAIYYLMRRYLLLQTRMHYRQSHYHFTEFAFRS